MKKQDFLYKLKVLLSERPWLLRNSGNIAKLAANVEVLEQRGLFKLTSRLFQSPDQFLENLAEVNLAIDLIRHGFSSLDYEPLIGPKPPDFRAIKGSTEYFLEIKRIGPGELERKQARAVKDLKQQLTRVHQSLSVSLTLNPKFGGKDVPRLSKVISQASTNAIINVTYTRVLPSE